MWDLFVLKRGGLLVPKGAGVPICTGGASGPDQALASRHVGA
jgi:hypothetical protein